MNIRHPPRRPPRTAKTAEAHSEEQVPREAEFKDKGRGKGCQGKSTMCGAHSCPPLLTSAWPLTSTPCRSELLPPITSVDARAYIGPSAYHGHNFDSAMKDPAPSTRLPLQTYSAVATGSVLLLAFFLRLWRASGTFLNLDEAMHFLAANKPSLAEAYRSSLNLAHPPLLILFLNVWKKLGTSELALRLPSVIAGTIFCWIFL